MLPKPSKLIKSSLNSTTNVITLCKLVRPVRLGNIILEAIVKNPVTSVKFSKPTKEEIVLLLIETLLKLVVVSSPCKLFRSSFNTTCKLSVTCNVFVVAICCSTGLLLIRTKDKVASGNPFKLIRLLLLLTSKLSIITRLSKPVKFVIFGDCIILKKSLISKRLFNPVNDVMALFERRRS